MPGLYDTGDKVRVGIRFFSDQKERRTSLVLGEQRQNLRCELGIRPIIKCKPDFILRGAKTCNARIKETEFGNECSEQIQQMGNDTGWQELQGQRRRAAETGNGHGYRTEERAKEHALPEQPPARLVRRWDRCSLRTGIVTGIRGVHFVNMQQNPESALSFMHLRW